MSTSSPSGSRTGVAERMGVRPGMIVMEIGYDEDVDDEIREQLETASGEELVEEDSDEVVDCVVIWYRDGDSDLADLLVDAIAPLADSGFIWLLTPKRGRSDYVEPSDISEAASVAGLSQTSITTVQDWSAARLVGRKSGGGGRK